MFILKKLFSYRGKSGDNVSDKPFMAHLEDLRDAIVKIVITLLVSTLLCYVFKDTLMEVLRRPIEKVWYDSVKEKLPDTITPETWEKAKLAANHTANLSPEQRTYFFSQFDDSEFRFVAQCASYYRIALIHKDKEKRLAFINDLPEVDTKLKETLAQLIEKHPSASLNSRGDVVAMRSLNPTETFMLSIKLSVFAGIIISFPLLLYFILQFVLPGLKEKERKALWPAMAIGFGLFLGGVFFCYFSVLPKTLDFFFNFSNELGVQNEWQIGAYIGFATQFTLIFGLAFELPVVVMTLVKIGLLSYATMRNTRSYAIITIFVVAAIITPTGDALTLFMLAGPMYLLYEICIWLAFFSNKKDLAKEAEDAAKMKEYHERIANDPQPEESEESEESDYDPDDYHHGDDDYDSEYHDHEEYHKHDYGDEDNAEDSHLQHNDPNAFDPPTEPRIAAVPGLLSLHEDDDDEVEPAKPEDCDPDEGEELDDGVVEDHSEPESTEESDEDNFDFPDEDPNIDFNPGASFVDPEPEEETEEENSEDSDKKDKGNDNKNK